MDGDNKYSHVVYDRWTENTIATATYPRLSASQINNNFRNSDFWLFSLNRFYLAKVQLNYNFSGRIVRKTPLRDLGLFISGSNLLTVSQNQEIMDLPIGTSPSLSNYNIGVRAKF